MWTPPLFAEVDAVEAGGVVAGILAIMAALGKGVHYLLTRKDRREERANKRASDRELRIVQHQQELIERQDEAIAAQEKEIQSLRKEIRELWEGVRRQELNTVRMKAHVEYLEGMMQDAGMKFRPYADVAQEALK